MTLIDGVGDEVVQFGVVVFLLLIAVLAWWSTNARPDRYRTVLVMRSRTHPVTVSIRTRSNLMVSNNQTNNTPQATTSDAAQASTSETVEETPRDNARVIPLQEMDSIVDADMAMLDNHRLHFYRRMDSPNSAQSVAESPNEESEPQEEAEPASNAQMREMDSIVSAMEDDVTAGCDFFRPNASNSTASTTSAPVKKQEKKNLSISKDDATAEGASGNGNEENVTTSSNEEGSTRKILIKLKYLNDTLKEVEGSLDELLKDFKLRHFSMELSAECRVRLIFNGRVLCDEGATLRACGLHHRAVVHCLVHPNRNRNQGDDSNGTHELITERPQVDRPWDLENILMTLVSVALTVVWFFRCEYSNMFTASASVALFGLTVFYSVAIFALYLTDTFHIDRRAPLPAPHLAPHPAPHPAPPQPAEN